MVFLCYQWRYRGSLTHESWNEKQTLISQLLSLLSVLKSYWESEWKWRNVWSSPFYFSKDICALYTFSPIRAIEVKTNTKNWIVHFWVPSLPNLRSQANFIRNQWSIYVRSKSSRYGGKPEGKKANLPRWWLGGLVGRLAAPLLH